MYNLLRYVENHNKTWAPQRRFSLATSNHRAPIDASFESSARSDHLEVSAAQLYRVGSWLIWMPIVPILRANSTKTCMPITIIFLERQANAKLCKMFKFPTKQRRPEAQAYFVSESFWKQQEPEVGTCNRVSKFKASVSLRKAFTETYLYS